MARVQKPLTEEQKAQKKLRNALWYKENRERKQALARVWRLNNPEKEREISRRFFYKNREEIARKGRETSKANKEKFRLKAKKFREENREYMLSYTREQYRLNRSKLGSTKPSWFNAFDLNRLMERQNFRCVYCPASIKEKFHFDHKIPFILVGGGNRDNIQLLCQECNCRKGTKSHEDFLALKIRERENAS